MLEEHDVESICLRIFRCFRPAFNILDGGRGISYPTTASLSAQDNDSTSTTDNGILITRQHTLRKEFLNSPNPVASHVTCTPEEVEVRKMLLRITSDDFAAMADKLDTQTSASFSNSRAFSQKRIECETSDRTMRVQFGESRVVENDVHAADGDSVQNHRLLRMSNVSKRVDVEKRRTVTLRDSRTCLEQRDATLYLDVADEVVDQVPTHTSILPKRMTSETKVTRRTIDAEALVESSERIVQTDSTTNVDCDKRDDVLSASVMSCRTSAATKAPRRSIDSEMRFVSKEAPLQIALMPDIKSDDRDGKVSASVSTRRTASETRTVQTSADSIFHVPACETALRIDVMSDTYKDSHKTLVTRPSSASTRMLSEKRMTRRTSDESRASPMLTTRGMTADLSSSDLLRIAPKRLSALSSDQREILSASNANVSSTVLTPAMIPVVATPRNRVQSAPNRLSFVRAHLESTTESTRLCASSEISAKRTTIDDRISAECPPWFHRVLLEAPCESIAPLQLRTEQSLHMSALPQQSQRTPALMKDRRESVQSVDTSSLPVELASDRLTPLHDDLAHRRSSISRRTSLKPKENETTPTPYDPDTGACWAKIPHPDSSVWSSLV